MHGLELPAFEDIARKVRQRTQHLRRRQRCGGIAQRLHPPPERREYPQAPAVLGADGGGWREEVAREALHCEAGCLHCGCDLIGHRPMGRLGDLVPEYRAGAGLSREFCDDPGRRALAQHERSAERGEAALQGPQRLRQPPARSAAERAPGLRARRLAGLVEYVKANHRQARFGGRVQGGMIGKAQIVAKPDDAGGSGSGGHQGRSTRKARMGPRCGRCNFTGSDTYNQWIRASAQEVSREAVRCSLSGDAGRSHPDRLSVSRRRRQGLLHRASWRHARRDPARRPRSCFICFTWRGY